MKNYFGMKNNFFLNESLLAIVLLILLVLFLNPFDFLMPPPFLSMLVIILIAIFGIFIAVVWKEQVKDEREAMHRMLAGRLAFLFGSTILVIGIIVQELHHINDPWLIYALVGMLLAKIGGLLYGQKKY